MPGSPLQLEEPRPLQVPVPRGPEHEGVLRQVIIKDEFLRMMTVLALVIGAFSQFAILMAYFFVPRDDYGFLFSSRPDDFLWGSTIGTWVLVAPIVIGMFVMDRFFSE